MAEKETNEWCKPVVVDLDKDMNEIETGVGLFGDGTIGLFDS